MSTSSSDQECLCPPKFIGDLDRFGRPMPKIFAEYRVELFSSLAERRAFAHWQLGQSSDIGMMVLDWVAYLWDNLAFYNTEWMREQHLLTASQEASLTQLAKLTGYAPRPNLAATSRLVAISDAKAPLVIGPSVGITSEGGEVHGALPFETIGEAPLDPALNAMTVIMPRETTFDSNFIAIGSSLRNLRPDEPVLFLTSSGTAAIAMLAEIKTEKFASGESYSELVVDQPPNAFDGIALSLVSVFSFATEQAATEVVFSVIPSSKLDSNKPVKTVATNTVLEIAGVHPNYHDGQRLAVLNEETGVVTLTRAEKISYTNRQLVDGTHPVLTPFTWIELDANLPAADQYKIFSRTLRGARLVGAPKTYATLAEFGGQIEVGEKFLGDTPVYTGDFVVADAQEQAVLVTASLDVHPHNRRTTLNLAQIADDALLLKAPLIVHGNFLDVDQGKTVIETLGSAHGRRFQHFKLGQKPLTFLRQTDSDPAPAIELYVNNVLWTYASHLFDVGQEDRIYTLKMAADGQATIILGGAAKAGQKNVVARYRYGTTGENPFARMINTPAGRIDGVSKVFNPFPALGGLQGDTTEDVRFVLPLRISANDRCVSSDDYNVLARNFGAMSAQTRSYWNPTRKQSAVETMVIFEGGLDAPLAKKLRTHLIAHAPEASLVEVVEATPVDGTISLTIRIEEDAVETDVRREIENHFFNIYRGHLALRRIRIGHAYNRAEILGPLDAIPGLLRVETLALDGNMHIDAFPIATGTYLRAALTLEVLT